MTSSRAKPLATAIGVRLRSSLSSAVEHSATAPSTAADTIMYFNVQQSARSSRHAAGSGPPRRARHQPGPGNVASLGDDSEDRDGLLWWRDLARCHAGEVSVAVAQANQIFPPVRPRHPASPQPQDSSSMATAATHPHPASPQQQDSSSMATAATHPHERSLYKVKPVRLISPAPGGFQALHDEPVGKKEEETTLSKSMMATTFMVPGRAPPSPRAAQAHLVASWRRNKLC